MKQILTIIFLPALTLLPLTGLGSSSSAHFGGLAGMGVYKESVYRYKTDTGLPFTVTEYEPIRHSGTSYLTIILPDGKEYKLYDVTEAGDHKFRDKENTLSWTPTADGGTLVDLERERQIGSGILFNAKLVQRPAKI